jgi:DNA repair protein RadC
MKIKDLPKSDRPREKLMAKGADNLKDSELFVMGTATIACNGDSHHCLVVMGTATIVLKTMWSIFLNTTN